MRIVEVDVEKREVARVGQEVSDRYPEEPTVLFEVEDEPDRLEGMAAIGWGAGLLLLWGTLYLLWVLL